MMAARASALVARLPKVRGRYRENVALARFTWFRVGGPAEVVFHPADREDLMAFLARKPADVPLTVMGVGSNLLVRDGGIDGVLIRLGRTFTRVDIARRGARYLVHAGAGALDINVARACREAGVAGLEFLSGVPGTIGGALRMNAGAFGHEMKAVTLEAEVVDSHGRLRTLTPAELGFSYRHSAVPDECIFVAALLEGRPGEPSEIARRMTEVADQRETSQPLRVRTGGSTFVNPSGGRAAGRKAWQLIDAAGCRGLRRGDAMVSEKHCNFLVNTGKATAAELEGLGEEVRRRVKDTTGVTLAWEIRRVGRHARGPVDAADEPADDAGRAGAGDT